MVDSRDRESKRLSIGRAALLSLCVITVVSLIFALTEHATSKVGLESSSSTSSTPSPTFSTTTSIATRGEASTLVAISCISVNCVAVGSLSGGTGLVETSSNSGSSFVLSSIPLNTGELNGVSCFSATNCVAVGSNQIIRSSNNGSTWTQISSPDSSATFESVTCITGDICLIVGMTPNPGTIDSAVILRSTNGGLSFEKASYPNFTNGLGAIACPTSTTCIAVGATVMVSNDAGASWFEKTVNGGIDALSSISCVNSSSCIALGPNLAGISSPTLSAMSIETGDGGSSFARSALPPSTASLWSLSCNGSTCLAVGPPEAKGDPPNALRSSDSGKTWSSINVPTSLKTLLASQCFSDSSCVAVGESSTNLASVANVLPNGTEFTLGVVR